MYQQLGFGEAPSHWDSALVFPSRGQHMVFLKYRARALWDCNEYLQVFVGVIETHWLLVE